MKHKNQSESLNISKEKNKIICIKKNYFGEALKELRKERSLTQANAAELLGVSQALWSTYESGGTRPDLDTIIKIAKCLKISPFVLLNKSLDKSKYFDPILELTFDDFQIIEENYIESYRKNKLKLKLKSL